MPTPQEWVALVGFLALSYSAALVGGRFTALSVDTWYRRLSKPSWTPPGSLIGAVWTVLYALMGVAAWLAWREVGFATLPMGLFALQLALNAAWSGVFFGLRRPGLALAEILALDVAVLATLVAFWAIVPLAGLLFVPYAAWAGFATALTAAIWRRNPDEGRGRSAGAQAIPRV